MIGAAAALIIIFLFLLVFDFWKNWSQKINKINRFHFRASNFTETITNTTKHFALQAAQIHIYCIFFVDVLDSPSSFITSDADSAAHTTRQLRGRTTTFYIRNYYYCNYNNTNKFYHNASSSSYTQCRAAMCGRGIISRTYSQICLLSTWKMCKSYAI